MALPSAPLGSCFDKYKQMWVKSDTGTAILEVDNHGVELAAIYFCATGPTTFKSWTSITGVMTFAYSTWDLIPRDKFDVVGGEVFDACTRAMAWNGRLLVVGFASGTIPKFPVNLALVKGYSLVGVFWGSFTQREPKVYAENMAELMEWYAQGMVKPHVETVYPLEKAVDALESIHARKATGKVVLKP